MARPTPLSSGRTRLYIALVGITLATLPCYCAGLAQLTAGRTSIIIAHRLQTIQDADRVLVLEHGEMTELGTPAELLAKGGTYARLHALQFQATV